MKKLLVLAALLILLLPVFGITLSVSKQTVFKGETLVLNGTCNSDVSLTGQLEEKKIFAQTVACTAGKYSTQQEISLLVPSGQIQLTAAEKQSIQTAVVTVKPTRKSAFLSIAINSPTTPALVRTETVNLRVFVSDAQNPVENATVQSWLPSGEPLTLAQTENGAYAATLKIPFDANLGAWKLIVTAQAQNQSETEPIGGEQSVAIPIEQAPVLLEIESPTQKNISALAPTVFRFRAHYPDNSPLEQPTVSLILQNKEIPLQSTGNATFETTISFPAEQVGLQKMVLQATDSAANTGNQEFEFFVATDFQSQFSSLPPFAVTILILVGTVAFLLIPRIRTKKAEKNLAKRKKEIEQELTTIQRDYFERNAMDKQKFDETHTALLQELDEINKKLNTPKN